VWCVFSQTENEKQQWKPVLVMVTEKDLLLYHSLPRMKASWHSPAHTYPLLATRYATHTLTLLATREIAAAIHTVSKIHCLPASQIAKHIYLILATWLVASTLNNSTMTT
jgi:hypothetical protein